MTHQLVLFQKIFKDAEDYSGYSRTRPPPQSDTSVFDSIEDETDESGRSSRIRISDSDLQKLRGTIRKVTISSNENNNIAGKYIPNCKRRQHDVCVNGDITLGEGFAFIPEVNWQNEVSQLMKSDTSEEEFSDNDSKRERMLQENKSALALANKMNLLHSQERISFDIAPYNCFDTDYVDIDYIADPLDKLIPNGVTSTSYIEEAEETQYLNIDATEEYDETLDNKPMKSVKFNTNGEDKTTTDIVGSNSNNDGSTTAAAEDTEEVTSFLSKAEIDKQRKLEKAMRIKGVDIGFDAAASIERSANSRPRDNLPQYRSRIQRSMIAALNHCTIATTHKNAKPDLYEVELKYFHRPRMIKERDRPWQISLKTVGNHNNKKLLPNQSLSSSSAAATIHSINSSNKLANLDTDKQNLSLANNNINFILLEYIEEFPPVMLNYGMASAMFNYYRAPEQKEDDEEKRSKVRSESSKLVDSVLSSNSRSRLPRHVMLLLQLRHVKQSYEHDVSTPRLKLGETKVSMECVLVYNC